MTHSHFERNTIRPYCCHKYFITTGNVTKEDKIIYNHKRHTILGVVRDVTGTAGLVILSNLSIRASESRDMQHTTSMPQSVRRRTATTHSGSLVFP